MDMLEQWVGLPGIGALGPGEALKTAKKGWTVIRFIFTYNEYLLRTQNECRKPILVLGIAQ